MSGDTNLEIENQKKINEIENQLLDLEIESNNLKEKKECIKQTKNFNLCQN
jgi:hypothetical protein